MHIAHALKNDRKERKKKTVAITVLMDKYIAPLDVNSVIKSARQKMAFQ